MSGGATGARSPLVALIHATSASIGPAAEAFGDNFPGARLWNILDDQLVVLVDALGGLTPALEARMNRLIDHALEGEADAVALACSVYGPVAGARASGTGTPVLASDEAMFDAVRELRPRRTTVLGTTEVTAADTADRLRRYLRAGRPDGPDDQQVDAVVVAGGYAAAVAGDRQALERAVVRQAEEVEGDSDVVVVGQFSLSPATAAADAAVRVPVLSAPHLTATAVRRRVLHEER